MNSVFSNGEIDDIPAIGSMSAGPDNSVVILDFSVFRNSSEKRRPTTGSRSDFNDSACATGLMNFRNEGRDHSRLLASSISHSINNLF